VRAGAIARGPRRAENGAGDHVDHGAKSQENGGEAEDGGARLELGAGRVQVGWGELGHHVVKLENNAAGPASNRDFSESW
jgi:hypothetical protein